MELAPPAVTNCFATPCRIDDAGTLEEQLSYVPYLPFLSLASNRFPALAARMQAVYTKYFSAGKPVLQGLWPVQPLTAMVTGCWLGKLMSGEVSNSWAENVVENEQASLDGGQKVVCFGMIRSFEGLWEPQSSRRIDAWRIRVRQVHAEMDESAAHQVRHQSFPQQHPRRSAACRKTACLAAACNRPAVHFSAAVCFVGFPAPCLEIQVYDLAP